jgi:hypothetical protein
VGQRDAAGNPLLARLTPAEWAQIGPRASVRLSVQALIALSQQGVGPDEIIRRYDQTGTRLKLTEAQLAALRKEGVDQRVLDYIASAEQDAVRIDAITAQADQAAQARLAYDRALYAAVVGRLSLRGLLGAKRVPVCRLWLGPRRQPLVRRDRFRLLVRARG